MVYLSRSFISLDFAGTFITMADKTIFMVLSHHHQKGAYLQTFETFSSYGVMTLSFLKRSLLLIHISKKNNKPVKIYYYRYY